MQFYSTECSKVRCKTNNNIVKLCVLFVCELVCKFAHKANKTGAQAEGQKVALCVCVCVCLKVNKTIQSYK